MTPNVHFWKNQTVFEEGYLADAAYLICEGSVEVFRIRDSQHITLAMLDKDAIFGEMAIISDKFRSATVRAVSDVWCYAISKRTFLEKLRNIPPMFGRSLTNWSMRSGPRARQRSSLTTVG